MSLILDFPPSAPLPSGINSPPYVVFGIHGNDITSSLPPLIPLKVVLYFAPALRKWVLPAPDPTYLPRLDAEQAIRTPYVGIDIQASVEAEGLHCIVARMLHLSGRKTPKESFSLYPDLTTSLAIHKTWLALELPKEGLLSLHTYIHAQLMLSSPPVGVWDMRMLWDAFPHDSGVVWAMGLNFMEGLVGLEYKIHESLEILMWLQSTRELFAFFQALQAASPRYTGVALEHPFMADEKENILVSGDQTVRKSTGKAKKSAVTKDPAARVVIMERGFTKNVSLREREERQITDLQAMQSRLRKHMSNDSLRSVDTAFWDPEETAEKTAEAEEDGESVNDDMHDPGNYPGGSFSAALAKSLEVIKLRSKVRRIKSASSRGSPAKELTATNLQQHDIAERPVSREYGPRHRRSSSTATTTSEEHTLLLADLKGRLKALEEKRNQLAQYKE